MLVLVLLYDLLRLLSVSELRHLGDRKHIWQRGARVGRSIELLVQLLLMRLIPDRNCRLEDDLVAPAGDVAKVLRHGNALTDLRHRLLDCVRVVQLGGVSLSNQIIMLFVHHGSNVTLFTVSLILKLFFDRIIRFTLCHEKVSHPHVILFLRHSTSNTSSFRLFKMLSSSCLVLGTRGFGTDDFERR